MSNIFQILLLSGVYIQAYSKDIKMFIHDHNITSLNPIVNETNVAPKCKVNTRENPCDFSPKVTFSFLKPIQRPYLQFKVINVATSAVAVDQTLFVCFLNEAIGLDMLMKVLWDSIIKHLDFALKCPLPAGKHGINSFPLKNLKLIYSMMPRNNPFIFMMLAKINMGKKIVDVLKYTEISEIVEVD